MYLFECVCFAMTCALRWGVTHVGNYHYWSLLTLSRDHYFRYRERSGRQHSLEAVLRRNPTCGFDMDYVKHVLNS